MPSPQTVILIPMKKTDSRLSDYKKRYNSIRINLENSDNNYGDIFTFYEQNEIINDQD